MSGKTLAYSQLPKLLHEHRWTVADFIKKLTARGIALDKKSVYRLASPKPLQTINVRILGAVCDELKIGIADLITWQQPKPMLHRIDEKMQARLAVLMDKNNDGKLTPQEAKELAELGAQAERLSLENARILAEIATASRRAAARKGQPRAKSSPRRKPARKASA
jgi:DNA-binding Xre family transcriptional regulator